ncbi:MAG: sigma-70 family RNA polymerase sigma factor [Cyanobacteria bacterium P01_E01_bin.42]
MNDLDKQLQQLALEAKSHPQNSWKRRRAMDSLFRLLQNCGRLHRPKVPDHYSGCYEEIYAIAKQQLFCYLFEKIDKYDPDLAGVLSWVNFLLEKRFPNAIREVTQAGKKLHAAQRVQIGDLGAWLECRCGEEANLSLSDQLREYIAEDPEEIFRSDCIQGHPEASFRAIALRVLNGYSWKELAIEFNIKIPTLSSFYQRRQKKYRSLFRAYLE